MDASKFGYITMPPLEIKVKDGLDRYRKEIGNVKELAQSILDLGQIQPIVINRNNELIAGGRRLAACTLLNRDVKVVYEDIVDNLLMREWELEENIKRKDFTPAEEVMAVAEIHQMRTAKYGKASPGVDDGWSLKDTAELIGKSKASVVSDLAMADMIKEFPELKKAKSKSEIKKAVKGLEKMATALTAKNTYEKILEEKKKTGDTLWKLEKGDALELMKTLDDNAFDLVLTDPLYGINADKIAMTLDGQTGGFKSCGFQIDDDQEDAFKSLEALANESFRVTKENAHAYVFVAPEFFHIVRQMFLDAGWLVHIKPMIWVKGSTGQTNVPYAWPSSCYEMLLFMRKPGSKLKVEGQPDWLQFPIVDSSKKIHQFEKPIDLLKELIKRTCSQGSKVLDPFAGSAATLEAATLCKCESVGFEISQEAYSLALKRLVDLVFGEVVM